MRSAKHNVPTAAKRWMQWVGQQPCINCGATGVNVHHCVGATARHNKVTIGDWWILPLCPDCHSGRFGIHGDMSRFEHHEYQWRSFTRKEWEKMYFLQLCENAEGVTLPPCDVQQAIADWHL